MKVGTRHAHVGGRSQQVGTSRPPDDPVVGWGSYSQEHPPDATWTAFGPESPFNTPVPGSPSVDSRSSDIIAWMNDLGHGNKPQKIFGNEAGTAWDFDHPIYWSTSDDPLFTLNLDFSDDVGSAYRAKGLTIHIPDAAQGAAGTDRNMAVIDQANNVEYQIEQMTHKPSGGGSITGNLCGKTPHGANSGHGLYSDGTAAWQAQSAGVIRPEELAGGLIDHALIYTTPGNTHSYPKIYPTDPLHGTGALNSDPRAPKLGQWMYLAYDDGEIAALDIDDWQKTILYALAHYGMYLTDSNGSNFWRIQVESGSSRTDFGLPDPWMELGIELGLPTYFEPAISRTLWVYNFEAAADWTRLVALNPLHEVGYGK